MEVQEGAQGLSTDKITPRSMRRVTTWLLGAAIGGLAIYDLVPFIRKDSGDTVSEVLRDVSRSHPILAFALGAVVGHALWPIKEP
jgi:hypothetical protein